MNITKQVTKEIINPADKSTTTIEITAINEEDQAIFCNLYEDDKLVTTGRVYTFDNFPCDNLNHGEKELIKGNAPTDEWYVEEIKLWLDSKQTKIDDQVSKDDQFYYKSDDLKSDLLEIVNQETILLGNS